MKIQVAGLNNILLDIASADRKFEDVVKSARDEAVLVLVY